jgi:hypothetical protein
MGRVYFYGAGLFLWDGVIFGICIWLRDSFCLSKNAKAPIGAEAFELFLLFVERWKWAT